MVAELQNSGDPVRQWFPGLMSLLLLLLGSWCICAALINCKR